MGAIIAMVGVDAGAQQIAAMVEHPVRWLRYGYAGTHMGSGATKTLVYADMLAILRVSGRQRCRARWGNTSTQVVFGNRIWATRINGTEPQYFEIRGLAPFRRGAFTPKEL